MMDDIDTLLRSHWSSRSEYFQNELFKLLSSTQMHHWMGQIIPHIKNKNASILDAGCANGFISFLLCKAGFFNVTGIDFCEKMISDARGNAIKLGCNINFQEEDIVNTNFANDSFDFILCRNVLWQLSKPKEALKELYRILKRNGVFIYFDANRIEIVEHNSSEKITLLANALPSLQHQRPQWDFDLLSEIGFKSINIFESVENLKDSPPYSNLDIFKVLCRK